MLRAIATLVLVALVAACGSERGAPRVRPLPSADPFAPVRGAAPRSQRIANYKIDVQLDPATHVLTATQTLSWMNTGTTPVTSLPFHMYLNAFKNDASLFMRTGNGNMRGAQQTTWGWIDVESVRVGDAELRAAFTPAPEHLPDTTVYNLALLTPVEPGGEIAITMKFTAQLPEVWARTGYSGEFHLVGQWFPKIGVRTGAAGVERWECAPFHAFNEFFADFGQYDVSITVPSTYVVAATGVLANATEAPGGTRTYQYRAEDVHDFAWMADPYMELTTAEVKLVDGSVVAARVYARPEQADFAHRHLDAATGALERFSALFVPYPWPVMTVVDPPLEAAKGAGGMEYPMFVTTAGDGAWARPGIRVPEYVTVHEVGHNWFQGMLASNEPTEPWMDEGLNSWADGNVLAEMYGARGNVVDWMGWQADVTAITAAGTSDPSTFPNAIATPAAQFADFDAYSDVVYAGTTRAIATLENIVGPKRFAAAMNVYATEWAFRHPTGADFIATLSRELGQDLGWYFGPVFQQIGGLQLAIRDASCSHAHAARGVFDEKDGRKTVTALQAPNTGAYRCSVTLTNTGPVRVPVDIELRFVDGGTQRLRWDPRPGLDETEEVRTAKREVERLTAEIAAADLPESEEVRAATQRLALANAEVDRLTAAVVRATSTSWKTFVVERSSPLTEVWVDPDGKLLLANPLSLRVRLQGDGAAAMRAGAWTGAAVQTLMQVIGP